MKGVLKRLTNNPMLSNLQNAIILTILTYWPNAIILTILTYWPIYNPLQQHRPYFKDTQSITTTQRPDFQIKIYICICNIFQNEIFVIFSKMKGVLKRLTNNPMLSNLHNAIILTNWSNICNFFQNEGCAQAPIYQMQ